MSLTQTWAPYFLSKIRTRGREYQRQGRVQQLPPHEGELLRAQVDGEDSYLVTVGASASEAVAHCTCPYYAQGAYCKHIWAALVDFDLQAGDPDGPNGDDALNSSIQSGIPQPPKARKRTGPREPMRPRQPQWMTQLGVLRLPSDAYDAAPPPAPGTPGFDEPLIRRVYYLIQPHAGNCRQAVVVRLAQRTPRRGGWSSLKRLRVSRETLRHTEASLEPEDRALCAALVGAGAVEEDDDTRTAPQTARPHAVFQLPAGAQRTLIQRMIATGRCMLELTHGRPIPLDWDGDEPWQLWAVGVEDEDALEVSVELRRGEDRIPIDEPSLIVPGVDGLVINHGRVAPFDDGGATRWVRQFREEADSLGEPQPLRINRDELDTFLERLYQLPRLPALDLPDQLAWPVEKPKPSPRLDLFSPAAGSSGGPIEAVCYFDYAGHSATPDHPGQFIVPQTADHQSDDDPSAPPAEPAPTRRAIIQRDLQLERRALAFLELLGFSRARDGAGDRFTLTPRLLPRVVDVLTRWGWVVRADRRIVHQPSTPRLSVVSGMDWFELRGAVAFETATGVEELTLPQILAAAREGKAMITLSDGSQGLLPQQWLAEHGLLAAVASAKDDHLRFKPSQTALLDALLSETLDVHVDERFAEARRRLHEFDGVVPIDATPQFHGELRPYQKDGLGWLAFLRRFMMGGVLADDMGLGKTIQVLAMFDRMREEAPQPPKPSLIVVPRSVVFNWLDEAEKFTPNLRILPYTGPERHALRDDMDQYDLVITSYGLLRRDINELRNRPFHYVILDEAQAIKNPQSQAAKSARLLQADHRLALTGTPVENHLGDLWSIFEFLNPGLLGSATRFGELIRQSGGAPPRPGRPAHDDADLFRRFAAPIPGADGADGPAIAPDFSALPPPPEEFTHRALTAPTGPRHLHAEEAASLVGKALRPFILRRTKKQVLDELPEKTEQTILCQMEPPQRKIYQDLLKYYRGTLLSKLDAPGSSISGSAIMVLEALLRLRQAACHPALIDKDKAPAAESAKLEVLMERIADLVDEGHKALIFSQFTSFLALVRERLEKEKITYEYLDGQTRNRKERVERFQTDPDCPLFLISLKAGGLGLNLTAASYVFILDPWWNPAVEAQAIDRAHRIGQTQHVFAYRLICEDTVEQRIIELQNKKRQLADAIVTGQENLLRNLTRDDLEKLLS